MKEIWKDIPHYEGLYQVSNLGRVWSNYSKKVLKQYRMPNGYMQVMLYKLGKGKKEYTHRLVAMAFIANPENLPQVNHKDEVKDNNVVENLEWVTQKQNLAYGTGSERSGKKRRKPIVQYTMDGELVKVWPSIGSAAKAIKDDTIRWNLYHALNGEHNSAYGYVWKYANED